MALVTCDMGVSTDGYVAGPNQSLEHPLGEGAERLRRWMFERADENAAEIAEIVAAGEKVIAIAGGASTVRQYFAAGLIDVLRLHIAPVVLRAGAPLLAGLDDVRLEQVNSVERELVTHVTYRVMR